MKADVLSGFSSESEGAAIASIIGGVKPGIGVHVFILSVTRTDNGWTVSVMVVTEPELESTLEKRLKLQHEEEEEEEEELEKEQQDEEKNEIGGAGFVPFHYFNQPHFAGNLHNIVHVHISTEYDHLSEDLDAIAHNYQQEHDQEMQVHFVQEGPLWENVQEMFVDNSFNLAALEVAPKPTFEIHDNDLKPSDIKINPEEYNGKPHIQPEDYEGPQHHIAEELELDH